MNTTQAHLIESKSLAEMAEQRLFTFRASTAAVDRQGEVIDQAGWMLEDYKKNPVILDSHRYGSIDDVLGRAVRVEPTEQGLEVDVEFAETERGQMARRMVQDGFLRTVSVGFRSLERRPGGPGQPLTHAKSELLEVSMVAIPANRDAVRIRAGEPAEVQKTGRKISRENEERIREAVGLLMAVINTDKMEEPDTPTDEEKTKPKAVTLDPGTLAALGRFAQGGENHG
jgi:HK97 family phage prohead protease